MSFADAVSRIDQIQAQIESVQSAFAPSLAAGTTQSSAGAQVPSSAETNAGSTTFADALAQAQSDGDSPSDSSIDSSLTSTPPATSLDSSLPVSALASSLPTSALASTLPTTSQATAAPTSSLPASAQSMLTTDQQQFASRLTADTGLDPGVISAWLLAEESGGAAQSRQGASNNDWLNIGYTDSATYGASDSVWSDPTTAADATAGWLKGQNTIPGYGTASSGIEAILGTAGQGPAAQIAAIQQSGWASSGYPDLPGLYQQVAD
ncbi:MAG: hypothetical protein ABSG43_26425 [Solirubrobacteraceae bacterium]|jgi:hypothetical protein